MRRPYRRFRTRLPGTGPYLEAWSLLAYAVRAAWRKLRRKR